MNYVVVTDTDVQTIVTARNGRATPDAIVAPGHVEYCPTSTTCQPVAVDSNGASVGPAQNVPAPPCPPAPAPCPNPGTTVPVPGSGGSAESTVFKIRTVNPKKETKGGTGSVDAVGLDIEIRQPGNSNAGIPDASIEYILGEGHADGFASAPLAVIGGGLDLTGGGGLDNGPVAAAINDIAGANPGGGGAGTTGTSPVKRPTGTGGVGNGSRLLGVLAPNFLLWFYLWEASSLLAAAVLVWARRRRLKEMLEEVA